MKKAIILFSLVGLMISGIAFGQTVTDTVTLDVQAVQQAESITTSDLGVSNPGLLPTNPFYFFKEFSRNVQRVFTFNPVAKAQLEVKIANEKVAEAKKIQETAPNDNNAIIKGVKNYQAAQERVNVSLESLKTVASTTPGFEMLMNSVATDVVSHQKVLDEMGIKASDSVDVKNAVDSAKIKIDESAATAIQDNPTDFANKLQNALVGSKGSDLKHVRSVEIITNIEARAPEAAKPALLKVQENLTNKLNENIQQATEVSGSAAVQRMIKEIPSNDSVQRAVIVKQLQQKIAIPSVKAGGGGGSAVSVISICDSLKQSLEQLVANVKSGILTEEQYNLKYGFIKKELEQCINKQQPQPTTTTVKKEEPVSTGTTKPTEGVYCTQEAKLCSDGSYVGRTGLNCEFAKCPGESGGSGSILSFFSGAYWQCYDSKEFNSEATSSSCKSSEEWQAEAKKFCEGHCYADNSRCGVNSFGVSSECVSTFPTSSVSGGSSIKCLRYDPVCGTDGKTYGCGEADAQSAGVKMAYKGECSKTETNVSSTETAVKEECGKENEKVNRDALAGPITRLCCYGLKEDRSNKAYSICIKPLETTSDTTVSISATSNTSTGIANPTMVCPMLSQISPNAEKECMEKGGKIMSGAVDRNGCTGTPICVMPTASSDGSSAVPATSNTSGY